MTDLPAELAGRVAVVTGGTRGIGYASGRALAAAGATVILTGRDPEVAKARAEQAGAGSLQGVGLDVTDEAAVQEAFRAIAREHGRLDILVAAAGTLEERPVAMMDAGHVQRMLGANVAGTLACLRAASQMMLRKRSGAIVLFGSVAAAGVAGQTAYAAAKAAVEASARSAARELGPFGIRVNALSPGVIRTDLTAGQSPEVLSAAVARTPLRRLGEADDVARVVTFLVSDAAAFVTGQVIGVDGGLVL